MLLLPARDITMLQWIPKQILIDYYTIFKKKGTPSTLPL